MEKQFIVYMHKCLLCKSTNGIYIGSTSQKPWYRWTPSGQGYLRIDTKTGKFIQPKIAAAIVKYGIDCWTDPTVWQHSILYTNLSKNEAEQKEIELIAAYNSYYAGLNSTKGGGGYLKYYTAEEAFAAIQQSRKAAHIKWDSNPENLIKNKKYRHTSYINKINDPEKYARFLEQKRAANAKRKLNKESVAKDARCKAESQQRLRPQVNAIRHKLITLYKNNEIVLTDKQYETIFKRKGSHYACNSLKALQEILASSTNLED